VTATRGIDIAASVYIRQRLIRQRDSGTAVLVISEDLDEVMAISDRIAVMYEGMVIGEASPGPPPGKAIGLIMAGVPPAEAEREAPVVPNVFPLLQAVEQEHASRRS
jgi:general nucleoside transport system ATP-binding protein